MCKRASRRRKGKRKEYNKKLAKEQNRMWRKLSNTKHVHTGYADNSEFNAGAVYCPYVPILRPASFSPGDTTA